MRTARQPAVVSPLVSPEFAASDNPVSTRSIDSYRDLSVEGAAGQALYLFAPDVRGSGHFMPFGEFYDASGTRQGTSFPIAVRDGDARYPRGAFDGTNWLVVWTQDVPAVDNALMGARFTPSGEPLDGDGFVIATDLPQMYQASIASDGAGHSLVVWSGAGTDTYCALVDESGAVGSPVFLGLSVTPLQAVAFDGTNFLVAYREQTAIAARRVSTSGAILDTTPLTLGTANPQSLYAASTGNEFLVGYQDANAMLHVVGSDGALGTSSFVSSEHLYGLAAQGSDYIVSTSTGSQVQLRRMSASLATLDTETLNTAGTTSFGALTEMGDATFLVYHGGFDMDPQNVFGTRVGTDLTVLDDPGIEVGQVANLQSRHGAALGDDVYFVAWNDERNALTPREIYGTRLSLTGEVLDPNGLFLGTGFVFNPDVAFNGTHFLVVFETKLEGDNFLDIVAVRVSPDGTVVDSTPLVITNTSAPESRPQVASDGTDWLVTWHEGPTTRVKGAVVSASGSVGAVQTYSGAGPVDYSALEFNGTHYLSAFRDGSDVEARRIGTDGVAVDAAPLSLGTAASSPLGIATDGTGWLVAWTPTLTSNPVRFNRVGADGTVLDGTGKDAMTVWGSAVSAAFDGTNYWVGAYRVTVDGSVPHDTMSLRSLTPDGTLIGDDDLVLTEEHHPWVVIGLVSAPSSGGPVLATYGRGDPGPGVATRRIKARFVGGGLRRGSPCSEDVACESGSCADGYCCDSACDGGDCRATPGMCVGGGTGGASGMGGEGGAAATGGAANGSGGDEGSTGGAEETGGASATGGADGTGADGTGADGSGANGSGAGGNGSGADGNGTGANGGNGGGSSSKKDASDKGGCGCRVAGSPTGGKLAWGALLPLLLLLWRRRAFGLG